MKDILVPLHHNVLNEVDTRITDGMTSDGFRAATEREHSEVTTPTISPALEKARIDASLPADTHLTSTLIQRGDIYELFEGMGGKRNTKRAGEKGIELPDKSIVGIHSKNEGKGTLWKSIMRPPYLNYPLGFEGTPLTFSAIHMVTDGEAEIIVPDDETIHVITATKHGIEGHATILDSDSTPERRTAVESANLLRLLPGFTSRIRSRLSAEGKPQPVLRAPIMTG